MRIIGIFAHPDDPEFSMGGSAAIWADQGHEVYYCIITDGSAGSNDPNQDLAELVTLRQAEQRAAAAIVGVKDVIFLGYRDGTLEPTIELRRELTRLIRQLKPDRVVSGDPTAFFYGDEYLNHSDHRAAAEAAITAVFPSAPTRPIFPELLAEGFEPHQVRELYITNTEAGSIVHIDITSAMDRKIEALRCHKSQLDPGDGTWIREWAAQDGKAAGLEYAESFRVMRLVREPEGGAAPPPQPE
ncbi:MAG: PIG-L deacetylase family protein [Roseiflexaceae bacterium]|nr:PIG-L deacetylase family protein [Roseiflexaceae bacterium]